MKIFFTSDYHLGHFNIIRYCNRPFKTLYQMNKEIIRRHNERVKPDDTVFFLGDFCFKNTAGGKKGEGILVTAKEWKQKLNGKFIFIRGNHDRNNTCKTPIESIIIKYGGHKINLTHNPFNANKKLINFVGHVHIKGQLKMVTKG